MIKNIIKKLSSHKNDIINDATKYDSFVLQKYKELIISSEKFNARYLLNEYPKPNDLRIELLTKLFGTSIYEAFYIINYLNLSLNIDGDICEFGIAQGATSSLMANEIVNTKKNIWLFDSFEGLPKPTEKDILIDDFWNLGSMEAYAGTMACSIDEVKSRIDNISFPINRVKIIPGFIEETINYPNLPKKICFAYIDFDFYQPILIALNYLDKTLQKGGYIVVDDYGFFSEGAKTAVDEFLSLNKTNYTMFLPEKFAGAFCIIKKLI